ncbi:uncharacterized protein LOC126797483, partial [Argentina anserina]|uniref:uncharacterized protein LOC126797483 n=1 Tax=Argentina anserina TaxID=57926 RepID=UPI00217628FD
FAVISKQERGHGYGIRIRVSVLESPPSEVCSRISLRRCWKHRKGTARQTDEKRELRSIVDEEGRGVFCSIVGCGARLICSEEFEEHYNARQTASCSVCSRVYPASRLLGIHVSEAHSSFFQAKVAHGDPMYECLVEGCDLKLESYKCRQQHLVDKHKGCVWYSWAYKKSRLMLISENKWLINKVAYCLIN